MPSVDKDSIDGIFITMPSLSYYRFPMLLIDGNIQPFFTPLAPPSEKIADALKTPKNGQIEGIFEKRVSHSATF